MIKRIWVLIVLTILVISVVDGNKSFRSWALGLAVGTHLYCLLDNRLNKLD